MATDLETRSASTASEAHLQRKFADLSARVKRVDFLTHLLLLALTLVGYAVMIGWFDWFAGNSQVNAIHVLRWTSFGVFVGVTALLLVLTARCLLRRVNPYFVADQLERTCPDAKNSLINWLDLHDQGLPSAFQKHLSKRAAEHFDELDSERTLPRRRNRILLGVLALPTLGLLVLLLLGPAAFMASMLRAFAPFYAPPAIARTQITLLEPAGGDAEVGATQTVTFVAKIDGRIPASYRPDAPRLLYRYQANEDYFTLPLQAEIAGTWTAQLSSDQLRTGFSYKIAAGDAETPEHQVRVRGRAHVQRFEITYHDRPYLKHAKKTVTFPNKTQATPVIHGMRGAEVDLIVRASRPVKKASIAIIMQAVTTELPTRMVSDDPHAFTCRFTLEQSGQFRVRFTATDGEENVDRGDYPIDVRPDDAPTVVLTKPATDVSLALNGTLEIEGRASDDFGVKSLTLHVRVLSGPHQPTLQPKVYRAGKSLQLADGAYPGAIDYQDFLALDELKDANGTTHLLAAGTVLEYWLEAADNADYPNPTGNVGKSAAYKVTLLPKSNDSAKATADRKSAEENKARHDKQQDDRLAQKKQNPNPSRAGSKDGPNELKKKEEQNKKDKDKLDKAAGSPDPKQGPGQAKGSDSPNPDKKDSNDSKDGPGPKDPSQKSKSPDGPGNNKDKGEGKGGAGESKADGKKQESKSKGDPKDGKKDAKDNGTPSKPGPMGQAKSGGPKGDDAPAPQSPKEQATGDPMPTVKQAPKEAPLAEDKGNSKGPEQDGPEANAKDAAQPPMPGVKGSKPNDSDANNAEPKQTPPQQAKDAAQPRGNEADKGVQWEQLAKLVEKVGKKDENSDAAGKELADIAKNSEDPRKREIANDILKQNNREPDTGKEKKKAPNLYGSNGPSKGIGDDIKADAANREFTRRIGQMQLDDWKKRITPEVLKKAGMSQADFERFVKDLQAYDALVQKRNADLLRNQVQSLRGNSASGTGLRVVEGPEGSRDPLDRRSAPPPPELRDVQRRFTTNP